MPTLYVTEPGTQVHKIGERLVLKKGQEVVEEIPMVQIDQVVMMGRGVGLTTAAMFALVRKGAEVIYLSGSGRFISRVAGSEHKHSRLRHAQALMTADERRTLAVAGNIVQGKISNQRTLVRRHAERADWAMPALAGMDAMLKRVSQARTLDELRGFEGQAAKEYFFLLRRMLAAPRDGPAWGFERRAYYPPPDPVNALLSFGYTLLLNDLTAACQMSGLDPDLGCFHVIDYGRPSMALDLVEEFRPVIVDSMVLGAINQGQFALKDFQAAVRAQPGSEEEDEEEPSGTVNDSSGKAVLPIYLTEESRRKFLTFYEERVTTQVVLPQTGEHTTYRRIFLLQAQGMARVILGEQPVYQPYLIR